MDDWSAVGPGARCVDGNALAVGMPILGIGLVVGLIVSIGQAVTSVQEQSLSFLPKLVAMIVVAVLLLGWMVARLGDFTRSMFAPDIFG